jgi:predicted nucleotidyltransferase
MVETDKIKKVVELLKTSTPLSKIILFGSYARGDATENSDIDIMIIKPTVIDRAADMVALSRMLSPLRLPVEILIVSEAIFNEWSSTPGNIYYEVLCEGQLLYDPAA